jgi:hypothetical protein
MEVVGFEFVLQPCRNITLPMQYTPDINVIFALDKKNQMRVACQWPGAQAGNV